MLDSLIWQNFALQEAQPKSRECSLSPLTNQLTSKLKHSVVHEHATFLKMQLIIPAWILQQITMTAVNQNGDQLKEKRICTIRGGDFTNTYRGTFPGTSSTMSTPINPFK